MKLVAALGGNALLRRGEPVGEETQRENIARAVAALAPLCLAGHGIAITHGNGPQVGLIALQNEAGPAEGRMPFDVLGAQSAGMIGHLLELEFRNALRGERAVAALLTQVEVDPADPAFQAPTKPVGMFYSEAEARRLERKRGWKLARDGKAWRRVVASPQPLSILDSAVIEGLVAQGVVTICLGGGGIPVARGEDGSFRGLEAVIDKDLASSLLAIRLDADALLLLTDVDAVYRGWGTKCQEALGDIHAPALDPAHFEAGTMRPKVAAARAYVEATGRPCMIGRLEDVAALLEGKAGTRISA